MKKLFLLLLMAVVFCGNAQAQKGMHGIGVNVAGAGGSGTSIGGGVKYQYNLSNYLRLEPSFSYYIPDNEGYTMAGMVDLDIFFSNPRVTRPYLFVGFGYVNYQEETWFGHYAEADVYGGFGINIGLGVDWRIADKFSVQLEAGYMASTSTTDWDYTPEALKFNIGFCYNF